MTTSQLASDTLPLSPPASGSARINVGASERLASLAGGALLALAGMKLRCRMRTRLGLLAGSGLLMQRGLTGHSYVNDVLDRDTSDHIPEPLQMKMAFTIARPRYEVYAAWRKFEDFPSVMEHLTQVTVDGARSHWVAPLPGIGGSIEWDAELVTDEPGECIAWRSLPGAVVDNAGEVRFTDAPRQRGTAVHVQIAYRAPAGDAGRLTAMLLRPTFAQMVEEDVRRLKSVIESGEKPTTAGQPRGRRR